MVPVEIDGAGGLSDSGCPSGARDALLERADEEPVEEDVEDLHVFGFRV